MDGPMKPNSYNHITADGHAGQHNRNVYNNQSYNYTVRQRRSDEMLRESAGDRSPLDRRLLKAAAEGQTKRVEYLIRLGADRDFADKFGLTALHFAAREGFEDTVEVLLNHFVDINAHSDLYGTPICLAAARGRENIFDVLLKNRANVHANAGGFGSLFMLLASGEMLK